jgi:hypothetical protein
MFILAPFHMHPAQARREQQLRQLVVEGVPLRTLGKSGHWIVGPLHIYAASGRWLNAATGRRGRLNDRSIRRIVGDPGSGVTLNLSGLTSTAFTCGVTHIGGGSMDKSR